MGQYKIKCLISSEIVDFKGSLIAAFKIADSVCFTTDCWSAMNRSFIRFTANWLENRQRK